MSARALAVSIAMATVWTVVALLVVRHAPPSPTPLRTFVVSTPEGEYQIKADEAREEGFCSVFIRGGERIASVCGQHTWSQAEEASRVQQDRSVLP